MGQKINPIGFRLGETHDWKSQWIASSKFGNFLHEDYQIRKYLQSNLTQKGMLVGNINIKRELADKEILLNITVSATSKTTRTLDKKDYSDLQKNIANYTKNQVILKISAENTEGYKDAQLIAIQIANMFERRKTINQVKKEAFKLITNVKGAKIEFSGRFQGATMARKEFIRKGEIPLHTIRVPIDYGFAIAYTIYGTFGIKVWLNRNT